jgi:hypothetical protein
MRWLTVALLITLTGCAQPPRTIHATKYKTDLGSRIDLVVHYHDEPDTGIVVVDISNPRGSDTRYWLVQTSETDGQRIIAARRFYSGIKRKHQEVFRVPLALEGISESFYVEALTKDGKLILKSEPIINSPKEGIP